MYPKVAAIGIAGAIENNTVKITNASHWDLVEADKVAVSLGIQSIQLINDFAAAG